MGLLSLFLLAVFIFVLGNLVLLPLWLTATSLAGSLGVPGQFLRIATNRRLRQNHAIEHATLNVIQERFGPQRLAGMSDEDGFVLKGRISPEVVRWAVDEGLERLKRGESRLAIHERCGTSIAAANLVTSLTFLVLLLGLGRFTPLNVVVAMVLVNLGGPFFGLLFQRLLTTTARVGDVGIAGIECGVDRWPRFPPFVNPALGAPMIVCRVRTALTSGRPGRGR